MRAIVMVGALTGAIVASAGCSGSGRCRSDVPFSVDDQIDQARAGELASMLGVSDIDGHCEDVCTLIASEPMGSSGATFEATSVGSCTLVPPSVDAMGDPVSGSIRCQGAGDRCDAP